ncbi:MAG: PHP domain-containing protein [Oligosphaeraceae bacterium]|nr:PHP domain-containing protein [Oligosphaeraceae bacterium]
MIDLHCHSTASDGSATPREIIDLAIQEKVTAIALTDHDTIAGLQEFQDAGGNAGITVIPGIELSAREENHDEFHFVGLFIDAHSEPLQAFCHHIRTLRQERNYKILEHLPSLNCPLTLSEVEAECPGGVIGRPHIAAALIRRGYFRDSKQVFKTLLGRGCPGYIARQVPTAAECINAIHQAGGVAIWAHPFTRSNLTNRHFRTLVTTLKNLGLDGIEAYYPIHTREQTREVCKIAAEDSLLLSGGSDFHGLHFPSLKIGVAYGKLNVPDRLLPLLQERARRYS